MNLRHLALFSVLGLIGCAQQQQRVGTTHTTAASATPQLRLDASRVVDEQALDPATPVPNLRASLQYDFLNALATLSPLPAAEGAVLALDDVTLRTEVMNGQRVVVVRYQARWIGRDRRVIAAFAGTTHARALGAHRRELSDAVHAMYEQLFGGLDGALRARQPV